MQGGKNTSTSRGGGGSLLLAIPLGAFGTLIGGALFIALAFGHGGGCGSEATGVGTGVPKELAPIYEQAAERFGLGRRGPAVLASINYYETDFGANQGPSSAGAIGWMQFMPESWETFGVDGDGDGDKDPSDPWDAIFAAARLLRYSGAPQDWHGAVFSYNHADWYVAEVLDRAHRYEGGQAVGIAAGATSCAAVPGDADLRQAQKLFAPRAFKPLPARLWVGGGAPESVDARIWPDAVWLLESFDLRVTAAREEGHVTHGDGTAVDMVPAPGKGWDETARAAAEALGWVEPCGESGAAPICPLMPAIQFVGYNGYSLHGDPAHAGGNAHLHVSWKSSDYGCPGLCPPREWVEVFPWGG
jgi:hypothetical protein